MATWREVLRERSGSRTLAITAFAVALTLYAYSMFLGMVEGRNGVVLADPLLAAFPARDLTWPIFAIIYGSLIAAVVVLMRDPMRLLLALRAYVALVIIRMVCMWVVPLDPPVDMIPLVDPIVQSVTGAQEALSRDLFFSGHTSILTLLACVMPQRWLQICFLVLAVMVGCFVLLQHVHYTVDVLVAPMAAYAAYKLMSTRVGPPVRP